MLPYIAVARRKEHDFRIIADTTVGTLSNALREEIHWLALDWWGNCFVEHFCGAFGHFRSRTQREMFLLMLVQRGPVAPDRFVAVVPQREYERFRCNPFRALHGGVFDFMWELMKARNEQNWCVEWKQRVSSSGLTMLSQIQEERFAFARRRLLSGSSIIIPTQSDGEGMRRNVEQFTHATTSEGLAAMNICTFSNTAREHLDAYTPLICGLFRAVPGRTFNDAVDEMKEHERLDQTTPPSLSPLYLGVRNT